MRTSVEACIHFLSDDEGLSVVEYVIGAALLATALSTFFLNYGTSMNSALNSSLSQ